MQLHFFIFKQSSPRRVAVPVLVKDGKPCSSGDSGSTLDYHGQQHGSSTPGIISGGGDVKSEYVLPAGATSTSVSAAIADMGVADLASVSVASSAPAPPLPTLMHMGYGGGHHRHQYDTISHQSNMCTYLPHRSNWQ